MEIFNVMLALMAVMSLAAFCCREEENEKAENDF